MNDFDPTRVSKHMSYLLRHAPQEGDLVLDKGGWTPLEDLVCALNNKGLAVEKRDVYAIVAADAKMRFSIEVTGWQGYERIRANQGHSVELEMDFEEADPPALLYHGTVERFLEDIFHHGLQRMARHHVHLSADIETATKVAQRRGKPVILVIDATAMRADGYPFWRSANGVWLVDNVQSRFLSRL